MTTFTISASLSEGRAGRGGCENGYWWSWDHEVCKTFSAISCTTMQHCTFVSIITTSIFLFDRLNLVQTLMRDKTLSWPKSNTISNCIQVSILYPRSTYPCFLFGSWDMSHSTYRRFFLRSTGQEEVSYTNQLYLHTHSLGKQGCHTLSIWY